MMMINFSQTNPCNGVLKNKGHCRGSNPCTTPAQPLHVILVFLGKILSTSTLATSNLCTTYAMYIWIRANPCTYLYLYIGDCRG